MSNFVIAVGHTASGTNGCGVIANLDESNCTREIAPVVVRYLKERGHSATLLRVDKGNSYSYEDCYVRANQANSIHSNSKVDLYVEIHINAGGGTGSEVLVAGYSGVASQYASKVSSALSSALGIRNRGVKTQSLIVLKKTVMPAILVECLFADSSDSNKYNPEVIGKAIADGLVGNSAKFGWNKNSVGWWYCTDAANGYYYTSANGWQYIDGEWYIFDDKGYALENEWYYDQKLKGWYYLDENCKMVRSLDNINPIWKWIDSACYAFDKSGRMYENCITPDGWRVDESGAWVPDK